MVKGFSFPRAFVTDLSSSTSKVAVPHSSKKFSFLGASRIPKQNQRNLALFCFGRKAKPTIYSWVEFCFLQRKKTQSKDIGYEPRILTKIKQLRLSGAWVVFHSRKSSSFSKKLKSEAKSACDDLQ